MHPIRLIPVQDGEALIKFLRHGRVLACALAYAGEHAEVTARVLLYRLEQFDSVLIVSFENGHEVPRTRIAKEARRAMRDAYKEGLLS